MPNIIPFTSNNLPLYYDNFNFVVFEGTLSYIVIGRIQSVVTFLLEHSHQRPPLLSGHSHQRPPLLSGQISDALR
jgi:hypothetical protein